MKYKISKTEDLQKRLNNRLRRRLCIRLWGLLGIQLWDPSMNRLGDRFWNLLIVQLGTRLGDRLERYEI
jgi:hypothetical protein